MLSEHDAMMVIGVHQVLVYSMTINEDKVVEKDHRKRMKLGEMYQ